MKKTIYIIPGWEETTRRKPYKALALIAANRGYDVHLKNVDWKKPLSKQIFSVHENAVIFGFSLGAVLAWLVAQQYPAKHIILASMTPHSYFKNPKHKKSLATVTGMAFVKDVEKILLTKHRAKKQTILYGDKEEEQADILVKNTQHELNDNYIKAVIKLL